ncbi:endoglucanase [Fibrobacteria bacterium R8-3-H12]
MKNTMFLIIMLGFLITSSFAGPVSHFGMLKACKIGSKGQLCGEKTGTSTAIQVKGPSFYWSVGTGVQFYSPDVVDWFVDNMQIGIIRAAMGIQYYKENSGKIDTNSTTPVGYQGDPARQKAIMKTMIEAAIVNDIYVIIDWHSHNAHTASESALAKTFFREMATEYKNVPNIIWEIYNEPVSATASTINTYATDIIKTIRDAGSKNLVIIGSNFYSQKPGEQATTYGSSDKAITDNVAFVFHFYSEEHSFSASSGIGGSATTAMNGGYAVIGSEWGFTNANGSGNVGTASNWTSWMDNNKISNCNWSVSNLSEKSAMFSTSTTSANLSTSNLTTSGKNFQTYMGSNKWTAQIPADHPRGNDINATVKDGNSVSIAAAALGLTGNITGVVQPEFGNASFTANSLTYTTSASGSPEEKVRFAYKITQGSVTVQRRVTVTITDRRPILPQKNPIIVSRKIQTKLGLANDFSPKDPANGKLTFKEASLSDASLGTIAFNANRDSLFFTPAESMRNVEYKEVALYYTIQSASGLASSAYIILKIQNLAPIINTNNICCLGSKPNTDPIGIGIQQVGASDREGDKVSFVELYLDSKYPGRLQKINADSFVYYPENNKTGKVVMLAVVTDGFSHSVLGKTNLTLTGSGQSIGDIAQPTEIPGYVPPIPVPIMPINNASAFGMRMLGSGNIEVSFAKSGFAKLDIYSLSGKNMGTLLNGYWNAGSGEFSIKSLNLQKGVYILRLSQGTQTKTLRIVN